MPDISLTVDSTAAQRLLASVPQRPQQGASQIQRFADARIRAAMEGA